MIVSTRLCRLKLFPVIYLGQEDYLPLAMVFLSHVGYGNCKKMKFELCKQASALRSLIDPSGPLEPIWERLEELMNDVARKSLRDRLILRAATEREKSEGVWREIKEILIVR